MGVMNWSIEAQAKIVDASPFFDNVEGVWFSDIVNRTLEELADDGHPRFADSSRSTLASLEQICKDVPDFAPDLARKKSRNASGSTR